MSPSITTPILKNLTVSNYGQPKESQNEVYKICYMFYAF